MQRKSGCKEDIYTVELAGKLGFHLLASSNYWCFKFLVRGDTNHGIGFQELAAHNYWSFKFLVRVLLIAK